VELKLLGERGSGMLTDRASIREAEALARSGNVDVVIAEDLARVYRKPYEPYEAQTRAFQKTGLRGGRPSSQLYYCQ
jgi:hypothetical protein